MLYLLNTMVLPVSRNPFLSRAGFDGWWESERGWGVKCGRNPFLSRAGFDAADEALEQRTKNLSQSLFK